MVEPTDKWFPLTYCQSILIGLVQGAFVRASNWMWVGSFCPNTITTQLMHIQPLTKFCLLCGLVPFTRTFVSSILSVLLRRTQVGCICSKISQTSSHNVQLSSRGCSVTIGCWLLRAHALSSSQSYKWDESKKYSTTCCYFRNKLRITVSWTDTDSDCWPNHVSMTAIHTRG